MFPFWGLVIAPVLEAAEARSVVEIGALRGDNTRQIIEALGPDAVLHVIDPVPGFDPTEHEREFPGRYVFHQALSLDVLGTLPPMDAALVDGDHNWYTVVNELRLLREVARAADAPLPVILLHDVGWPYGRRDLYYSPDTIPAEFRQPHRKAGMRPGRSELLGTGGMSAGLWNAETEGGPRNGVMTAVDDFVASHDRPLRTIVLPLYFGLAIVVEEERLVRQPALAAALDRIEGAEVRKGLIELGEEVRLRGVVNHHTAAGRLQARLAALADRYVAGVARQLGASDASWLAPLCAALAERVPGAIVVAADVDPAAAVVAAAWLVATDDDRPLVAIAQAAEPVTAALGAVDLPADRGLVLDPASTDGDDLLPTEVAVLLGTDETRARFAPLLRPDGRTLAI